MPDHNTVNDAVTPLHLLTPDYQTGYGIPAQEELRGKLQRILTFIQGATPAEAEDQTDGHTISDFAQINSHSQLRRGLFRLASYEWGVTYQACLHAAALLKDEAFLQYVRERVHFLSEVIPHFKAAEEITDPQVNQIVHPHALDDCGAVCCALMRYSLQTGDHCASALIENYFDFIEHREYHLADGTYARTRPFKNTVWLDDFFMAVPALAVRAHYEPERAEHFYAEAVRQFRLFKEKMFVPECGLFRHGWVQSMSEHPAFFWGRANGWAFLTMSMLLDLLPPEHEGYAEIAETFRQQATALAACQGINGFWHQLLNRTETYEEGSATSIYAYCLLHGINEGYLEPAVFGPCAVLALQAVLSAVDDKGQVHKTCVGTGMGFDPAFYAYRPVHTCAAHGYGPALLALTEGLRLHTCTHPRLNDSAVQFYSHAIADTAPIFYEK